MKLRRLAWIAIVIGVIGGGRLFLYGLAESVLLDRDGLDCTNKPEQAWRCQEVRRLEAIAHAHMLEGFVGGIVFFFGGIAGLAVIPKPPKPPRDPELPKARIARRS
jgi:hypothetical protein